MVSFDVNYLLAQWPGEEGRDYLVALLVQAGRFFFGFEEAGTPWRCDTPAERARSITPNREVLTRDDDQGAPLFTARSGTFVPAENSDVVGVVGTGDAFAAGGP